MKYLLLLLICTAMCEDLSADIFTLKKGKIFTFLGKSTDAEVLDNLQSLVEDRQETLGSIQSDQGIKFMASEFLVDEFSQNQVRAPKNEIAYVTDFENYEAPPKVWSDEKLHHFKKDCVYIFSECNYQGAHMKACKDSVNNLIAFPFELASLRVPEGAKLAYTSSEGVEVHYSNQECLKKRIIMVLQEESVEVDFP